jgi:hypothetical protein
MLTRDQMVAFAAFLQSEKERHQEDIVMIDAKLEVLRSLGIEAEGTAPWIKTEDLYEACEKPVEEKKDLDIYEEEPEHYPVEEGSWVIGFVRDRSYA